MKKTRQNKPTHARFWSLIKAIPGYEEKYKHTIKEGLVGQYSEGRTCSLSEMYTKYPAEYSLMIEDLKGNTWERKAVYNEERDKTAKRVLAVICSWLDKHNYVFASSAEKLRYVKAITCRATNCSDFNKIPLSRLQEIYGLYCNKNKVNISNPVLDYPISKN
ncbi:MAG: hypothetical protein PHG27_13055 [Massilibacteroides sp.]|nr:hypothetical protein [Massilibacteroides sp.]MDD4406170.1 hypothetical protein [Parabacteroides sp.]